MIITTRKNDSKFSQQIQSLKNVLNRAKTISKRDNEDLDFDGLPDTERMQKPNLQKNNLSAPGSSKKLY